VRERERVRVRVSVVLIRHRICAHASFTRRDIAYDAPGTGSGRVVLRDHSSRIAHRASRIMHGSRCTVPRSYRITHRTSCIVHIASNIEHGSCRMVHRAC
jgi:hypothetical protein